MKKIAIDIRMMGLEHAGIGRYVENLVKEFKKNQQFEFWFFKTKVRHYSFLEQIVIPWVIWRSGTDLVHFPHFNVPLFSFKPYVVTIHDLIKHKFYGLAASTHSTLIYWLKYWVYLLVFRRAVRRAKKIIVPSQAVKDELLEYYRLDPKKIVVVYEGVSEAFQKGKRRAPSQPLLVYTGSLYPHKNIERLLETVESLDAKLMIVCARSVFWQRMRRKIKKMGLKKKVELLGFVPDKKLAKLYHQATALVQPSLMEGFDLTVIEAMACGLPVVISNIPVHREIAGRAAIYFNPRDKDDMARAINRLLQSDKLQQSLRQKGLERAQGYSWPKMAQQTVKVYESCFGL